jgi:hypothetical protein
MTKRLLTLLIPSLFAISAAYAVTGDDLLGGLPAPPDSQILRTQDIASGGQLAHYMTRPTRLRSSMPTRRHCRHQAGP